MYRVVLILALTAATNAASAGPEALESQALTTVFTGATIHLDTPLGTTVPVHYGDNGQVSGEAGSVAFALGSATDRGRWWVENNRLCHRWNTWFDRENQCLRLSLDGSRLFWVRDDGKTGTATLVSRPHPPTTMAAVTPPSSKPPQFALLNALPPSSSPTLPQAMAKPEPSPPLAKTPSSAPAKLGAPAKPPASVRAATVIPPATAKPTPPAAATTPPPQTLAQPRDPLPTYKVAFVEEDDVLNVRTGPSTDYDAIGAIPPTAQGVKIMGVCEDEWCPIVHRNTRGWVNRYYLIAEQQQPDLTVMHTSTASRR